MNGLIHPPTALVGTNIFLLQNPGLAHAIPSSWLWHVVPPTPAPISLDFGLHPLLQDLQPHLGVSQSPRYLRAALYPFIASCIFLLLLPPLLISMNYNILWEQSLRAI